MWKTAFILGLCTVLCAGAEPGGAPTPASLNHELFIASTKGDLSKVKALVAQGADPQSTTGPRKLTPLMMAAAGKHWDIVRYFINTNVDMNDGATSGSRALVYVLEENEDDIALEMINAGADPDFCDPHFLLPITYPAQSGDVRLMQAFIDHHANVNLNGTDGPAILFAVGHDRLPIVQMLLDAGADINIAPYEGPPPSAKRMSLVGLAAQTDDLRMIDLVLDHGADINAMGDDGLTPLTEAIIRASASPDTIRHLIDRGADVNKPDAAGETPLMLACKYGFNPIGVIQPLLDHGAKVEGTDACGRTTLIWCAMDGDHDAIPLLLKHGANVNAKDSAGETALTYAADQGDEAVVVYLRQHGAKRTDEHIIARPFPHPPLSPAQAWTLAAAAMYAQVSHGNPHTLGRDEHDVDGTRRDLKKWWGATDAKSFRKVLADLHDQGFGSDYRRRGAQLDALPDDSPASVDPAGGYTPEQIDMIRGGYRKWGDRMGLAWDLCRYVNLVNLGFEAGYLDDKEAWTDMMPVAREIQARFHSWREMSDNFLNGRIIWNNGLDQQFENCVALLLNSHDPNSVWNQLPWQTNLGR